MLVGIKETDLIRLQESHGRFFCGSRVLLGL